MTYKILHDLCPENPRHKFTERSMISENRTRNSGGLEIPKDRLEYAKRSFYFTGVKNWNHIPDNVRERDSIARFRAGLRDYLLNLSRPLGRAAINITILSFFSYIIFEEILSVGY